MSEGCTLGHEVLSAIEGKDDVALLEAGTHGSSMLAILANAFDEQSHLVDLLVLPRTLGQGLEPHAAECHPAQTPGAGPPGDIGTAAPAGSQNQREVCLQIAPLDQSLEPRTVGSVVEHPLDIGDRQDRLTGQRDDLIARLEARLTGRAVRRHTLDASSSLWRECQPQKIRHRPWEEALIAERPLGGAIELAVGVDEHVAVDATARNLIIVVQSR